MLLCTSLGTWLEPWSAWHILAIASRLFAVTMCSAAAVVESGSSLDLMKAYQEGCRNLLCFIV